MIWTAFTLPYWSALCFWFGFLASRSARPNNPAPLTYMQKMRAAGIVTVNEPLGPAPTHLAPTRPRRSQ